ncbi:MAG: choice-of-anchor L domain-containing protein [Brumimicrobium sp.]|nr:choice-of-anchor L domain-containing protein [Brumimicrobium sp.]
MKNRIIILILALVSIIHLVNAQQITTTAPNITPVQAVEDILLGAGINAFNITYNGSAANAMVPQNNVQEFDATGTTFPIETGVLMSTDGTGNLNDPDVSALTPNATNGAIIEFDFVPTGDTLSFNYVFASSEYADYTCGAFNDVFAFFISGPGINGPYTNNAENIATVPGSANIPVAINSVNSGSASTFGDTSNCSAVDPNWQANSIYFTTGFNTLFTNSVSPISGSGFDPAFNGSTVMLPATSDLVCSDTFHIKLVIANDVDQSYQSGVFLQAKSFKSNIIQVESDASAGVNVLDSVLIEGCSEGVITFIRPEGSNINDTISAPIFFGGSATQGDDFNQLFPGDSIVILPGVDTISVQIIPVDDGITEGLEEIIISVMSITECGDTVYSELTFYIDDQPYSTVTALDTTILCANDSVPIWVNTVGGFPPYTYEWDTGDTGDTVFLAGVNDGPTSYIVTSTDACGFEYQDTATITLNQTLAIDTMIQFPATCGEADGVVSGMGSGFTGTPDYTWTGPGPNSPSFINASVWENLSSGWYYFTIEDDVCSVNDSIFLEQDPPPTAAFTANPPTGNVPLEVQFTNNSDPNADSYSWNFGNGDSITVNNLSGQSTTYTEEGVYTVTLTVVEGSCSNQATVQIVVIKPKPLSFDMPNVFTPNGDGSNDVFTLNPVNAVSLELVILNRWGNVVFESNEVNASWNGKVQNSGAECSDGVYFYKFIIVGEDGEEVEQHGFVHLINAN